VPTDKRARQRAAREQKQAVIQKSRKRRRNVRRGIGLALVAALIVLIVFLVNSGSKTVTPPSTTTTSTFPTPTTLPLTATAVAPTCPPATGSTKRVVLFTAAPSPCIPATSVWEATFKTSLGNIVEEMPAASSYAAVNNFVFLALYHYFDDTNFFRVVKGFVVQGGSVTDTDANGATGKPGKMEEGYPGYAFTGNTPPASCAKVPTGAGCYVPGDLAMANHSGAPSSNRSEFFLILPGGQKLLSPDYTLFGHLVSGMSVLDKIGSYGAPNTATSTGIPTLTVYLLSLTVKQVSA
jgi:cyclophilin family peptidyl-prolyl cis-trans isomerase/predicted nucleic acid-binding Zn ribbon protein